MGKVTLYQREAKSTLLTLPKMFCCSVSKDDFVGCNEFLTREDWQKNGRLVVKNQRLEELAVIMANILPVSVDEVEVNGVVSRAYTENINGTAMRVLEYANSEDVRRFYDLLCEGRVGNVSFK